LHLAYLQIINGRTCPRPFNLIKKEVKKMININQEGIYDQIKPEVISKLFYQQVRRMSLTVVPK